MVALHWCDVRPLCVRRGTQNPEVTQTATTMAEEAKTSGLENNAAFMDLYSRQIGAYGIETMAKVRILWCVVVPWEDRTQHSHAVVLPPCLQLVQVKALIVGVKGVGMEVAKNLTLAGPKQVTLLDSTLLTCADAGTSSAWSFARLTPCTRLLVV